MNKWIETIEQSVYKLDEYYNKKIDNNKKLEFVVTLLLILGILIEIYLLNKPTPWVSDDLIECYAKTGQGWDKNLDSLCSILESELKTLDATFRFHTGGSLMKYTKKERMNIGRQIYEDQINKYEAAGKYGISAQTAREYMRMYRNTNHLPPKTSKPRDYGLAKAKVIPEAAKLDEYQKMSKEDLISALIDARIREERLKLGYEVVEEDDSKKKLITYVKKTAK